MISFETIRFNFSELFIEFFQKISQSYHRNRNLNDINNEQIFNYQFVLND